MKTEAELIETAIPWFEKQGWTLHKEVAHGQYCIDMVGVKPAKSNLTPTLAAIEAKLNLGIEVIAQARRWVKQANYAAVLVPAAKTTRRREMLIDAAISYWGVDVIEVDADGLIAWTHAHVVFPFDSSMLYRSLYPQQRDSEAGRPSPKRITPFELTRRELVSVIDDIGECKLSDAVKALPNHHWGSTQKAVRRLGEIGWSKKVNGLGVGIDELEIIEDRGQTRIRLRNEVTA